jgi:hypothetical protein
MAMGYEIGPLADRWAREKRQGFGWVRQPRSPPLIRTIDVADRKVWITKNLSQIVPKREIACPYNPSKWRAKGSVPLRVAVYNHE